MTACDVCGSSAPIMRASAGKGVLHLCYAHEAVCWPHKLDPCPTCDGADPALTLACAGCNAEPGEACRWGCLSHETRGEA